MKDSGGFTCLKIMRRFRAKACVLLGVLFLFTAGCSDQLGFEEAFPDLPDPTEGDADLPPRYRESLPRDAILPFYEPTFSVASDVAWDDGDLIIGVNLNGEARAYPVGILAFREMVIDNHRGIPTLVTW